MNEEQKNIETCLAENILDEVANVPTDAQFRSLVDEALNPLKQQALRQAGYDGYKEVVMYHQPYTFTSSVKQMKSNLILLLRRLWRFPFGRGTSAASAAGSSSAGSASASAAALIRSLADMWQHYITRLKGNPEYGIPSRLSQLTDLPYAPLLVADRKISNGNAENDGIVDGISLAHMLCSDATNNITAIVDDNTGWTMTREFSGFPNLKNLVLGCGEILYLGLQAVVIQNNNIEEINFPALTTDKAGTSGGAQERNTIYKCGALKKVYADKLKVRYCYFHQSAFIQNCNALTHFYARSFDSLVGDYRDALISHCANLTNVYLTAPTLNNNAGNNRGTFGECPKLIHLEVGCYRLVDKSLNIKFWNPTTALDSSMNTLIEEGSTATNNLQQFLSNARQYIVLRLAQRTSTTSLTLTLSPEVYKAMYGLDADYNVDPNALAQTASLADFGINTEDLNEIEISAGITTATKYTTWLDTYRGAIYWNVQHS